MIIELLKETYQVLKLNKIRTALTGLTVAWGIFMLITLLGYANGLINGFHSNMSGGSDNTVTLYGGQTTMEHEGYKAGRQIEFTEADLNVIKEKYQPGKVSGVSYYATRGDALISTTTDHFNATLKGSFKDQLSSDGQEIVCGRFINDADVDQRRKVAVLTQRASTILFRNNEAAIGKNLMIDGIAYSIIGVIDGKFNRGYNAIYVPITTFLSIYENTGKISSITLNTEKLTTQESNETFNDEIRATMGKTHHFNPLDRTAIWISNNYLQRIQQSKAESALTIAAWVIGLLSLISGIVGVSNIMFISVKERTHEIGIRRAIGAKPRIIYLMVMLESVSITTFFGYLGMVAGVAMNEISNYYASLYGTNEMGITMFQNPTVGMSIAIEATVTMIIAGIIAGLLPARKATKVRPVEALMDE